MSKTITPMRMKSRKFTVEIQVEDSAPDVTIQTLGEVIAERIDGYATVHVKEVDQE